jgi:thioredoxin reductase
MTLWDLAPRPPVSDELALLPVVIIGAGPIGLAAASNLLERGVDFLVLEAGDAAGAAIARWGHTRLFSPWRHLIDEVSRGLLSAAGWTPPLDEALAPTGRELVDEYLVPLAELTGIRARVRYASKVSAVSRKGMDRTRTNGRDATPFVLRFQTPGGQVEEVAARAVIDASGTFSSPNPLGSSGLDPVDDADLSDHVLPALPDVLGADRARFAGAHTTVVGAGHSAANTIIALAELARTEPATSVTWLIRNPSATRVSGSAEDALVDRALLGSRVDELVDAGAVEKIDSFEIARVDRHGRKIRLTGERSGAPATHDTDLVVAATGFRPDLEMLREIRLQLDDIVEAPVRLAPLIDPNVHSCGTVAPHGFAELRHPDSGIFIVGMKSYGRAPTFLLATGYEQVRSVAAWLDGDMRSASRVQLTLPATGVCSTGLAEAGACCS